MSLRNLFIRFSTIVFGALILMTLSLYNSYPFLDNDTGSYISSGFSLVPPHERPIFYGLFLRFFSFGYFLWIPVFVQSLLLSYMIILFIRNITLTRSRSQLLALVAIAGWGTIAGWVTGQLTADIFAPILFLSFYNFVYNRTEVRHHKIISLCIFLFSILVHNSHLLIATILILLYLLSKLFGRTLRRSRELWVPLMITVAVAWGAMNTANYLGGGGFRPSRSTHVFLMGRLVETGIMKHYLDNYCGTYNYQLCEYRDELPTFAWEYVWDGNSPLQKTGGWEQSREEHEKILADLFSRPRFIILWIYKSITGTLRQLATTDIDGVHEHSWSRYGEGSPPYENIKKHIPLEISELKAGKQHNKTLNVIFLDRVYIFVLLGSSIAVLLFWQGYKNPVLVRTYQALILFLVLHAFVTANFANVLTRLNSRVIWLLPLLNVIFLLTVFQKKMGEEEGPKSEDSLA